jgi:hypothetical protein
MENPLVHASLLEISTEEKKIRNTGRRRKE